MASKCFTRKKFTAPVALELLIGGEMRVLVQRVASARVEIAGQVSGAIGRGVLVFVGIEETDQEADLTWISSKLAKLRIFPDHQGG